VKVTVLHASIWRLGGALGLLVSMLPAAAAAQVVTLREVEQRALRSRTLDASYTARQESAEADIRQAASARYPQVALKAETTLSPGRTLVDVCARQDVSTEGTGENLRVICTQEPYRVQGARTLGDDGAWAVQPRHALDITANAPIYDFGRTKASIEAGKAGHAAVLAERAAEEEQLVRSVRAAYLAWLGAHEVALVSEAAARDAEERHARVAALVEQGVRPGVDLAPAQSDALLTKLEVSQARSDLQNARLTLEETIGEALPDGAEPERALLEDVHQISKTGAQQDPAEQALERQRAAALALARSYQLQRRPQLGAALSAGLRVQHSRGETDAFPFYGAGVTLAVPLYDGGLSMASAAGARAQADQIGAELEAHGARREQARRRAELESRQALESLAIAQQLLELSQKRLEAAQQGYELGANGIDAIADARSLMRRAQSEVLVAKVAHAQARMRFLPVELDAGRADAAP
jgi:outer membrane protein TolC